MQFLDVSAPVSAAIENAVLRSFDARAMRGAPTRAELKRRFEICERIWKVLRLEQRWSVQRVCDHLYQFLLKELDGLPWEPDRRRLWVPDGSRFALRSMS